MEKDEKSKDTCQIPEEIKEISEETRAWRKKAEIKSSYLNQKGQEVNNPCPNNLAISGIIKNHSINSIKETDLTQLVKLLYFQELQFRKMDRKETISEIFDFDCQDYYGNRS